MVKQALLKKVCNIPEKNGFVYTCIFQILGCLAVQYCPCFSDFCLHSATFYLHPSTFFFTLVYQTVGRLYVGINDTLSPNKCNCSELWNGAPII